jgi:hypothetical protein
VREKGRVVVVSSYKMTPRLNMSALNDALKRGGLEEKRVKYKSREETENKERKRRQKKESWLNPFPCAISGAIYPLK